MQIPNSLLKGFYAAVAVVILQHNTPAFGQIAGVSPWDFVGGTMPSQKTNTDPAQTYQRQSAPVSYAIPASKYLLLRSDIRADRPDIPYNQWGDIIIDAIRYESFARGLPQILSQEISALHEQLTTGKKNEDPTEAGFSQPKRAQLLRDLAAKVFAYKQASVAIADGDRTRQAIKNRLDFLCELSGGRLTYQQKGLVFETNLPLEKEGANKNGAYGDTVSVVYRRDFDTTYTSDACNVISNLLIQEKEGAVSFTRGLDNVMDAITDQCIRMGIFGASALKKLGQEKPYTPNAGQMMRERWTRESSPLSDPE